MIRTLDRSLVVAKRKPLLLAGFRLSNMDIEENLPFFYHVLEIIFGKYEIIFGKYNEAATET